MLAAAACGLAITSVAATRRRESGAASDLPDPGDFRRWPRWSAWRLSSPLPVRRPHTMSCSRPYRRTAPPWHAVPARVTLVFDKPALALGTTIEVQGPHGPKPSGTPCWLNSTVSEAIRAGAPAGAYVVRWRVTSADGHPISGSFAFTARASGGRNAHGGAAEFVTADDDRKLRARSCWAGA